MIPLKIDTLLSGRVVEQNRVEYKEGWNLGDIIHSICAFANDYHNMNGGYLVLGVRAKDGIPVLQPKGLPLEEPDTIQQGIFQYCNQIVPRYIPKMEVVNYQNKNIYLIYLWCTAGDSGPYQAPVDVYAEKGKKQTSACNTGFVRHHLQRLPEKKNLSSCLTNLIPCHLMIVSIEKQQ